MMERRLKGNIEISPSCPRCGSCNTKFCYYNNYSLTQPRYFCKACRRYWTKGGSLRNVPLGGGCRKNRRPSNTSTSSSPLLSNSIGPSLIPSSTNSIINHPVGHNSHKVASQSDDAPPHIDLALVYANFLHSNLDSREKPKPHDQLVMQTPVLDHSVQEYSSLFGPISGISLPLPQEQLGLTGYLNHNLREDDYQTNSGGLFNCMQEDRIIEQYCSNSHDSINLPLPALPIPAVEEETASHDDHMIMWSDSHEMMVNHGMLAPPPQVLGTQPHDEVADFIMPNWSPFRDDSFPRP